MYGKWNMALELKRVCLDEALRAQWHYDKQNCDMMPSLDPPRITQDEGTDSRIAVAEISSILGEVLVWMLDFNCMRSMEWSEVGVQQVIDAF
jgi:hypothetical protein